MEPIEELNDIKQDAGHKTEYGVNRLPDCSSTQITRHKQSFPIERKPEVQAGREHSDEVSVLYEPSQYEKCKRKRQRLWRSFAGQLGAFRRN